MRVVLLQGSIGLQQRTGILAYKSSWKVQHASPFIWQEALALKQRFIQKSCKIRDMVFCFAENGRKINVEKKLISDG